MEQMTRERLAMYRNNKAEILELDYMLQNRWKSDTMIGNNVIFDYSKGYPMTHRIFRIYYIDGRKDVTQREVARRVHLDQSRVSRKIDNYLENA